MHGIPFGRPIFHWVDDRSRRQQLLKWATTTLGIDAPTAMAAMKVAEHPNLEVVQVVSFGCGHDAVISDEVVRVLEKGSGKSPLKLKLDETDVKGPLAIRIRSLIETIRAEGYRIEPLPMADRRAI